MKIAVLLAACMVAAPAVAADQFDLVCSGTMRIEPRVGLMGAVEPSREYEWTREFQVDLKAGLYCEADGCSQPLHVANVTPASITFADRPADENRGAVYMSVNRTSGIYYGTISATRYSAASQTSASCKPAPFKPFPPVKQMF